MRGTRWTVVGLALLGMGCPAGDPDDKTDDTAVVDTDETAETGDSGTVVDLDVDDDGYESPEDCDDLDPDVNPGATEACNGKDDDCDDLVDVAPVAFTDAVGPRYEDLDGDTFGSDVVRWFCTVPDEGWVETTGDCADDAGGVNPDATEVCDTLDNDCDSLVDDDDPSLDASATVGAASGYPDLDGDGQDAVALRWSCTTPDPAWPSEPGTDCDDADASTFVGAAPGDDPLLCMRDADEDDYGDDDPAHPAVTAGTDCDDGDGGINPAATEVPYDGVVSDCGPWSDGDADHDGHDAVSQGGDDCDDTEPTVFPGGIDIPEDGLDQDCVGGDAACVAGDWDVCAVASCTALQTARPGVPTGTYWLDTGALQGPYRTVCEMDTDGGGWTLAAVVAEDGVATWTWQGRFLWEVAGVPVGSVDALTADFRSLAMDDLDMEDILFVHRPSDVWAAYHDVTSGQSMGAWIDATSGATGVCYGTAAGIPMTAGTLAVGGDLCSTDLYISPMDQDGTDVCDDESFTFNGAWGPAWSAGATAVPNGCPHDDPGLKSGLGPQQLRTDNESKALGWGRSLGTNTAPEGTGGNAMEIYVR